MTTTLEIGRLIMSREANIKSKAFGLKVNKCLASYSELLCILYYLAT